MRRSILFATITVLFLTPIAEAKDPEPNYEVRCQIFRVQDNVSGNTTLTDAIWPDGKEPNVETRKDLTWFTSADLKIGSGPFTAKPKGWTWLGKELKWPGDAQFGKLGESSSRKSLTLIASPSASVQNNKEIRINVTSDTPFEYFEKVDKDLYRLSREPVQAGLEISCTPRRKGDRVFLAGLTMRLLSIGEREPVEGVTMLSVGRPVQKETNVTSPVLLFLGRDYGMLVTPNEGEGLLLVRLRVNAKWPKAEEKQEKVEKKKKSEKKNK